jgi:hypothetical protein
MGGGGGTGGVASEDVTEGQSVVHLYDLYLLRLHSCRTNATYLATHSQLTGLTLRSALKIPQDVCTAVLT